MGFYDYYVTDAKGNQISLKEYENKVVLVVNTATACGFTPQYEELEKLHEKYNEQGLEILDIPCNQFGGQAPGSDEEIHEFCSLHFMNAHVGNLVPNFRETSDIKWNFTKFLVDRKGNVVARFEPTADMADVEKAIQELL